MPPVVIPVSLECHRVLTSVVSAFPCSSRYVLRGLQLAMLDDGGNSKSDPYLVATLGTHSVDCRSEYIADVTDARFFRLFEFETRLPGDSLLRIDVMDRDSFGRASDGARAHAAVSAIVAPATAVSARWPSLLLEGAVFPSAHGL